LIETDVVFEDEVGRVAIRCAVARGAGARYEQGHLPCVLWVSYESFCMVRLLVVSPSRLSLAFTAQTPPATAPASCAEVLIANPSSKDGVYWIKPVASAPAFQIYCEYVWPII
jgi:hypothetical protein